MKHIITTITLLTALTASAQTHISLQSFVTDKSLYGRAIHTTLDGYTTATYAGQFRAGDWGVAYCTDYDKIASSGLFLAVPVSSAPDVGWAPGGLARASFLVSHWGPSVGSHNEAAALQSAVWEVLIDTAPDIHTGRFVVPTPDVATLAQLYLSAPGSHDGIWLMPTHAMGGYRKAQGMLPQEPIPEASTVAAGLIAASGLALRAAYMARRQAQS